MPTTEQEAEALVPLFETFDGILSDGGGSIEDAARLWAYFYDESYVSEDSLGNDIDPADLEPACGGDVCSADPTMFFVHMMNNCTLKTMFLGKLASVRNHAIGFGSIAHGASAVNTARAVFFLGVRDKFVVLAATMYVFGEVASLVPCSF